MFPLTRLDITTHAARVAVDTGTRQLPIRHVIGIGRNYRAHAEEQGLDAPERPLVFTKSPASCCLNNDAIVIPSACVDRPQVDYEGELAVIIARPCRDIRAEEALAPDGPVLGFCVANDVSARWWQKQGAGGQFFRGKSFDTFCPLGPHVTPLADIHDPHDLTITTTVNGEQRQHASTSLMMFRIDHLIAELSRGTTLLPGTAILTGTPAGVAMAMDPPAYLEPGDTVSVSITHLGTITNTVAAE